MQVRWREIEGRLIAAGRTLAGLSVIEMARAAGVTPRTIGRIERTSVNGIAPKLRHGHVAEATLKRITDALARHGVELLPEGEGRGAGIRWSEPRETRIPEGEGAND